MSGCDDVMLTEIAQIMRTEAAKRLAEVEKALAEGDVELLRRGAHTLKGAAENFAAIRVVEVAKEIEALAKADDLASAQSRLEVLKKHVADLDAELQHFINRDQA